MIIDSSPALLERESLKRASLTEALTTALIARGIAPLTAALAAQSGAAAFYITFAAWIAEGETRTFTELFETAVLELKNLFAGPGTAGRGGV
jgi:hypothetical protein